MSTRVRPLTIILGVIGLVFVIVALVYFIVPARSLPSFIPGRAVHSHLHHTRRGVAALAVGVVLWIAAVVSFFMAGDEA